MLRVARLYYIDGLEQGQIAKREQVSRPTVSRLLALAREQGFVTITVNDDLRDGQVLKEALAQTYPTVAFTVVSTAQDDQKTKITKSVRRWPRTCKPSLRVVILLALERARLLNRLRNN